MHTKITQRLPQSPKIGLIIDGEKGKVTDVSGPLSEIISLGGKVMFAKVKCLVLVLFLVPQRIQVHFL